MGMKATHYFLFAIAIFFIAILVDWWLTSIAAIIYGGWQLIQGIEASHRETGHK